MTLKVVTPDQIWHAQYDIKFGPLRLSTRATFVKLNSGDLWVHSPVPVTERMFRQLVEIGPVKFVVAPNKAHHLFFRQFLEACPRAQGFIAPGLAEKIKNLEGYSILDERANAKWSEDFDSVLIEGLPVLNETVWFHRLTGTLILTGLLFCFAPRPLGLSRVVAQLLGVYDRVGMSRTMKFMVKDKAAFARSVVHIRQWEIERVIMAHDQIIEKDVAAKIDRAFEWLSV